VLYVEDNPINLKLVEAILSMRNNISFLSAPTAELGLELARAHCPDLILMDIHLPGMNGIEALKQLRTYEQTRTTPVVAVSASAMKNDIDRAMAAGFNDYLTKPFQMNELLKVLDAQLKK